MTLGSIRHQIRIRRPAATVWKLAGDAARLHEWFPGVASCEVDGNHRVITLDSGLPMPEEILVHDDVQRRFQYRLTASVVAFHRGMIDVIDLGDDTCLVVYSTDCDPRAMALTIGGATAGALDELRRQMEYDVSEVSDKSEVPDGSQDPVRHE
jgi:Polyketide cyclase / dehydrase and lipid transport